MKMLGVVQVVNSVHVGWEGDGGNQEKGRVAKEGVGLPSQLERTLQLGW